MTATMIRNSRMSDDWIRAAIAGNPFVLVDGRLISCPVRLSFLHAVTPKDVKRDDGSIQKKYEATMLIPPIADLTLPMNEAYRTGATAFPGNVGPNGQLVGVRWPFVDQLEKSLKYTGYTPGAQYLTLRSDFRPKVVDTAFRDITDPAQIYAGMWALVDFHFYANDVKGKKINVSLNSIMKFADDEAFGGGAPDPRSSFGHAKAMTPVAPPPQGMAAGMAMQGAPQGYAPASVGGYAPPAAQPAYAPPATGYAPPATSYAPVALTPEQQMLKDAGLPY